MEISLKLRWVKRISRNTWFVILGILLCAVAGMVYFSNLTFYSCFVDDEFQSAYAAYDLMNTGYTEYTRAYPATWLLAKWIAVFGFSELSCRSLSALYGVLAVASVVFFTKKMANSLGYTTLVSTMFIAEPILTYYFRFTRLYSLAVLLALWLYYFIYQWLTEKWWYFIPVIPLLLMAYLVNVNSLILMGGVIIFIIWKAFRTHRRLFIILTVMLAAFFGFSIVNLSIYHKTGIIPIDFLNFYGNLTGNASIDLSFTPNYIQYLLQLTYSKKLSVLLLGTIVVKSLVDKRIEDPLLFTGLIFTFTAFFMTFFAERYFTEQYIITAVPFVLMTYGYAYVKIKTTCFCDIISEILNKSDIKSAFINDTVI